MTNITDGKISDPSLIVPALPAPRKEPLHPPTRHRGDGAAFWAGYFFSIKTLLLEAWARRWTAAFLTVSVLLSVFIIHGTEFNNVNNFRDQSIQVPIIYSYADSSLYPKDFLLDARQGYVTWLYPILGWLSRVFPLAGMMILLYIVTVFLTIGAVYTLAENLFPRRQVGFFAVMLWMAFFPNPGGDFTHSPFVTHTTLAIGIELWALVLIVRRQHTAAGMLIGFGANINAMISFFMGMAWLFSLLDEAPRLWVRKLVRGGAVMVVTASPILLWRLSLPFVEGSTDQFVEIIRARLWYAVFPFSVSPGLWFGFWGMFVLWVYSFRYGKPAAHRQMLAIISGIGALCIVGLVFTEFIPLEFMIEMQTIRSSWLINLIILLYIAHMLSALLHRGQWLSTVMAFIIIGGFILARWIMELFPLAQPVPYPFYVDLDTAWNRENPILTAALLMALLLAVMGVFWRLTQTHISPSDAAYRRRASVWFGAVVVGFGLPALIPSNIPQDQHQTTLAWEETLVWIEGHTPQDALFVTPPTLDGFRNLAKRSQVGDWKDGTVGIFSNGWAVDWYARMVDMGFDAEAFAFNDMTQERLCLVAQKYEADYVVVFQADNIQGEPIYQNDRFEVIPIEQLTCPAQTDPPSVVPWLG